MSAPRGEAKSDALDGRAARDRLDHWDRDYRHRVRLDLRILCCNHPDCSRLDRQVHRGHASKVVRDARVRCKSAGLEQGSPAASAYRDEEEEARQEWADGCSISPPCRDEEARPAGLEAVRQDSASQAGAAVAKGLTERKAHLAASSADEEAKECWADSGQLAAGHPAQRFQERLRREELSELRRGRVEEAAVVPIKSDPDAEQAPVWRESPNLWKSDPKAQESKAAPAEERGEQREPGDAARHAVSAWRVAQSLDPSTEEDARAERGGPVAAELPRRPWSPGLP